MKITLNKMVLIFAIFMFGFISCEDDDKDSSDDTLYVKFENYNESEYTITGIQLLNMGVAGTYEEPVGEFGENVLTDGQIIAPGEHVFFTLDIPSSHYAYYRLTVDDGNGTQIVLHEQLDYTESYDGTITHWGGEDRTIQVTIKTDILTGLIWIQSWSDWVGIE
jgi:hypothetical protein